MSILEEELEVVEPVSEAARSRQTQEAATPGAAAIKPLQPTLGPQELKPLTKDEIYRPAFGAMMTALGAAFLVGGMFTGVVVPRLYAAIGAIVGVAMAVMAARATKRETLVQVASLFGIVVVGLILVTAGGGGFSGLSKLTETIGDAVGDAKFRRPPVFFDVGWKALVPWTTGLIGYAAAYVATVGRKPALGLLIPIPVIAFAAIAQPPEAQVPAGIVAFATFAIGLAIIYRADRGEGEGVSTAYEFKRAIRTLWLVIPLIAALVLVARTGFLFPEPIYDPTQRAQLPKPIPLSAVRDRVLFETQGDFTGPWRAGILSVYDGEAWRLPPYNQEAYKSAPQTGLLGELFNNPVPPQVRSTVTIRGLDGVVLPMPARAHGIRAVEAPALVVDPEAETVRMDVGQVTDGLTYDAVFALLPTEDALRQAGRVTDQIFLDKWTDTAGVEPPDAVRELLAKAPRDNLWDRFNSMRKFLLDTITATGQGLPAAIPAAKVEDMLAGTQEATPYEIVAAQVLMARWAGVPARIGYGFDNGEEQGSVREFRPKHGSAWPEVYFRGHGWFPVTGLPKKAKQSLGNDDTQLDAEILPSDDIAVELYIPTRITPPNLPFKVAQKIFLLVFPVVLFLTLIWVLWPMVYKARRTGRRRQWALEQGRTARIAVAYTEFRDLATDLGVGDPYATPLQYVERVVEDDEHTELAWLVTRCLWGDLRGKITDDEVFAAEELSRALRRRIFEAQPFTIRGISFVSRLSLRDPYAPELLSPPVPRINPGIVARAFLSKLRGMLVFRGRKEEVADEAVAET